jgi:uncharacterized damage-inducible protein DinB
MGAFSHDDAGRRAVEGAHSPWEIAQHALAWIEEVRDRLRGRDPGDPSRGDWPPAPEPTEAAWASLRAEIEAAHASLDGTLAGLSPERLPDRIREPGAQDVSFSVAVMLHGLAQHNAYHAGQLMLLRRAAAAR